MSAAIAPVRPAHPAVAPSLPEVASAAAHLMGGRVSVHLRPVSSPAGHAAARRLDQAERAAARTLRRIASWADRLTRFATTSELSRLNSDPADAVRVGPTLAAVLARAASAGRESAGVVDVTLLDERLAAERPTAGDTAIVAPAGTDRGWAMEPGRRGGLVMRRPGVRFDLGGVAKGWIADRAAAGLETYPAVLVDADGDLAISLAWGEAWRIGVADPRDAAAELGVLELVGLDPAGHQRFGLATSGTSVHRWVHDGRVSHHLIDPRTGRPAVTDVVQATVLADTASAAEVAAKSIVILGSDAGEAMLERPGIRAVIVLADGDRVLASPSTLRWLA